MPTYDYKCRNCAHQFEAFQSIKEDPLTICPRCGQETVQRVISAGGGLLFKGSGFYITDYRKDSYRKAASKDSPAKPATDSKAASPAPAATSTNKSD